MRITHGIQGLTVPEKRWFYLNRNLVYVRQYWRARPGMAWTGVRDVFVIEHVRRKPGVKSWYRI